ncbi:hypothetical protein BCR39DRAFT_521738 [Naematelia encephala]|uniref:Wings apart-like protein C-terminal domain-containing protein n=1 Tax=Naematelia encephala TaxID=71784 RepID=A0A1Y2BDG1_9TREE|nr:hypothetical protein BCR39DRAFT_521738 [Naematelia encephala]
MRSSSSSEISPAAIGSSTRLSRRTYSKRASTHVQKRKLENDEGTSDGSETDEDDLTRTLGQSGNKRSRTGISRASPSPQTPRDKPARHSRTIDRTDTRPAKSSSSLSTMPSSPSSSSERIKRTKSEQVPKAAESDNLVMNRQLEAPKTPQRSTTKRVPLTPGSSPRDLSVLFAAVSPGKLEEGISPRPGGMRRMLSKSRSAASSLISPSRNARNTSSYDNDDAGPSTPSRHLLRTQSLPDSPSKSSPMSRTEQVSLLVPSAGEHETSGGRAKRTYGKNRTILGEVAAESTATDNDKPVNEEIVKESYAELRKKYEVDNSVFDVDGSGSQDFWLARAPQVASDMRSKGENRRFMDEITYLTDGIADPLQSMSLKQSSSLDILEKMQDDDWLGKMNVCGQVERVWEMLYAARGTGDEIMDVICLVYLAALAKSGSSLSLILHSHPSSCLRLLVEQHERRQGLLDGGSKAKLWASKLRNLSQNIFPSASKSMSRTLALYMLQGMCNENDLVTFSRDFGETRVLAKVLKSFSADIKVLGDRFNLYEKGLDLFPDDGRVNLQDALLCLRIISSAVLYLPVERDWLADRSEDFGTALVGCLIVSTEVALSGGEAAQTAAECSIESLKILANLANLSQTWAGAIISSAGGITSVFRLILHRDILISRLQVKDEGDHVDETQTTEVEDVNLDLGDNASSDEIRSLCLAIMTSAIVADVSSANDISSLKLARECIGRPHCFRVCKCDDATSLPSYLAWIYIEQDNEAAEQDQQVNEVLKGYTALLLAKLMVGSEQAKKIVLDLLPGTDSRSKLKQLASSLSELKELQSAVHRKLSTANDDDIGEAIETENEDDILSTALSELLGLIEQE